LHAAYHDKLGIISYRADEGCQHKKPAATAVALNAEWPTTRSRRL